jgi:hypothetical protein
MHIASVTHNGDAPAQAARRGAIDVKAGTTSAAAISCNHQATLHHESRSAHPLAPPR